ncbi:LysE family translocator [Sulfitobacter sp. M57]|uniref:LysE family translocator n=1 Tax=unclassified Sulfitobacter TaxID=196795 RepID=UPI0023E1C380|nr:MULTISPECIES: LysE family translocator [unclassified Sulfitobacter]MDF3414615.1 LysE family translocator [Sulfitobacter sp. KE5]MDF3422097.1 LysE family translocator [Sulfitobacter sp. KE43]MDF3433162.1 LysE family translocator [Sulfitobacter sp. KE42]MDF3458802.1 LysE family translocator [Sulfitobacter sp. S74]MDF3462701.1 LysE family translocator [Sulfitobacter sp. Ks18]
MNLEILPALALFAFVSSATPGPNNLMLMASGANYGFRRTVPHMLGISVGFGVMMVLAGLGLVQVFERFPISYTLLKIASVAYMLYLAWKIANAAPIKERDAGSRPMTFLQAAAFQWVNPKAWAMALTAITVYVADNGVWMLLIGALCFVTVNLPSVSFWTVMGQQMARLLTNPARLRLFNGTMAVLLIASLYPLLQMG